MGVEGLVHMHSINFTSLALNHVVNLEMWKQNKTNAEKTADKHPWFGYLINRGINNFFQKQLQMVQ